MEEAESLLSESAQRKLKRKLKKAQKVVTEFELARSNDAVKRPGELLDCPPLQKKIKQEAQPAERKRLSPEEYQELKKRLAERKAFLTSLPRFTLQNAGMGASLSVAQDYRVPILVSDVQQLILYALGGNSVSHPPDRWCCLQKYNQLSHIVVMILEGISCQDFFNHEHLLPKLTSVFPERVEVMSPYHYGTDVAQEMACVPLCKAQKLNILKKYGSLEAALHSKEVFKVFRALFPINYSQTEADEEDEEAILSSNPVPAPCLPPLDMFPRTYLLLSLHQMVQEDYPLPFEFELESKYASYKRTKKKYKEVSLNSPIFAVDCEMCVTEKNVSELTRIAVVDENHKVLYESLVKPKNKITNYLTEFSGITKKLLENVTTTLEDVQRSLRRLLPEDAILVGHSLNCDLHAMKMMHPYVIDTSVVFNVSGIRNKKPKLSLLVESFLGEEIQQQEYGHCPVEDATATMKLVQLKLAKGFRFGDALTGDDSVSLPECQLSASIFNQTAKADKSVTLIAPQTILDKYKNFSLGTKPGSLIPVPIRKSKEAIQVLQEATVNANLSLAHLDLTRKVATGKMESVMRKVDSMAESIFQHVSRNGMFLMLLTGPIYSPQQCDSEERSSYSPDPISEQPQVKLRSHKNGACFIRINSPKNNS